LKITNDRRRPLGGQSVKNIFPVLYFSKKKIMSFFVLNLNQKMKNVVK